MIRRVLLLLMVSSPGAQAYAPACLGAPPVPIRVRIGAAAVDALLQGGSAPALAVVERISGRLLWSADARPPATQQFTAMSATFAGSLIALDLDGDGLHDRLYAGDLAGRLWRFDLHHGAAPADWATGGVFADFSNPSGRGFVAAPDVSLSTPAGAPPWFNIALGTAAPGNVATSNRYYVLRDHAPFEAWGVEDYEDWQPIRESDLLRLTRPSQAPDQEIAAGYFFELARGEVLSPSITVAGRATLAIADSPATVAMQCRVTVSVASLQVDSATATRPGRDMPWRERLPGMVVAGTPFTIVAAAEAAAGGTLPCLLGGQRVAGCEVDTSPSKTWWRREDAE